MLSVLDGATTIWLELNLCWSCSFPCKAEIWLAGCGCITLIVPINIESQYAALNVQITRVAN